MIFPWDYWLFDIFWALIIGKAIANGVTHLRFHTNKKLRTVVFSVLAYLVCFGASLGHSLFQQWSDELVNQHKKLNTIGEICSDWGKGSPPEERLKISQNLASILFVMEGKWGNYFDLNGKLTPYQPTDLDRQERKNVLKGIEQQENTSRGLFWMALGWMLVPLIGVGIGFKSEISNLLTASVRRKNTTP
jgi:hypothetical protein